MFEGIFQDGIGEDNNKDVSQSEESTSRLRLKPGSYQTQAQGVTSMVICSVLDLLKSSSRVPLPARWVPSDAHQSMGAQHD